MFVRMLQLTLLGVVAGGLSALAAIAFVETVLWLNDLLLISARSRMMIGEGWLLIIATVTVPALGGLIVGLLCRAIPERRPHGPPDAIQAVQTLGGRLPLRSGLLTAGASMVALGSGASVGQYGPLAHFGATLGSWCSRLAGPGRYLGAIGVGCGAAGAIAAAFNAPIAGLLFAHEVILRHFSLRAFAPVTVAATVGYLVANLVFDQEPLFRIETVSVAQAEEYGIFILIGIGGALVAIAFMRTLLGMQKLAARLPLAAPLKPALAGLILGVVALWLPDVLGIGKEVLRFAIIDDAFLPGELALILVAKLLMTALCLGFGFAGGVFSPALLMGVLFGALVGYGAPLVIAQPSPVVVYAICGLVAVTSPVIGAPLTTILIVFELTHNYDLATAAMVSVVFANLFAYRLFGRSLFDVQLARRGFDLSLGRDKAILSTRPIRPYMTTDCVRLDCDQTLARVRQSLVDAGRNEASVIDAGGRYCGTITLGRLLSLADTGTSESTTVDELARPAEPVFTDTLSIWEAMSLLEDFIGESIPVVDAEGRLLGVVYEAAIIRAYLDTVHDIRREEHAAV